MPARSRFPLRYLPQLDGPSPLNAFACLEPSACARPSRRHADHPDPLPCRTRSLYAAQSHPTRLSFLLKRMFVLIEVERRLSQVSGVRRSGSTTRCDTRSHVVSCCRPGGPGRSPPSWPAEAGTVPLDLWLRRVHVDRGRVGFTLGGVSVGPLACVVAAVWSSRQAVRHWCGAGPWIAGEPAARATAVLEQLQPPGNELLFTRNTLGGTPMQPHRAATNKQSLLRWDARPDVLLRVTQVAFGAVGCCTRCCTGRSRRTLSVVSGHLVPKLVPPGGSGAAGALTMPGMGGGVARLADPRDHTRVTAGPLAVIHPMWASPVHPPQQQPNAGGCQPAESEGTA